MALKIACWSSAFGGVVSAIALMTIGPLLARVTLLFGPAESFWIAMFGMVSVGVMVGSDAVKGILAVVLGLLIGTMGIDSLSGQARFTFDQTWLLGGLDLIVVLVGLYALPPVLLVPSILILMCVGVYVVNGRPIDLWVMLLAGLAGYLLEKVNVPLAPIILGMILGPMAEQSVRRALLISRGDATELLTRPLSAVLALCTVAVLLWPLFKVWRRKREVLRAVG